VNGNSAIICPYNCHHLGAQDGQHTVVSELMAADSSLENLSRKFRSDRCFLKKPGQGWHEACVVECFVLDAARDSQ